MPSRRLAAFALLVSSLALGSREPIRTQPKRPMTLVDLLNIPRIADPQLSPDGRRVTFMLSTTDWPGNRRVPQIWKINVDGTQLRRLTAHDASAVSARWSPGRSAISFDSRG